ncbi:MAG: transposase [Dorea sp.]
MPRTSRKESVTGIYHVMTRGLNKMPVFKEKREKTRMINLIRENLSIYDVEIFAYCIMSNHLHLLIKADLQELASFMAKILAAFAKYYNYKHNRIGYVFQSRYKSQCVENENYFWNCLRYIHRNPSQQEGIEELLKYEYSSLKELYYEEKDILDEKIFGFKAEKFQSTKDFLDFHKRGSWDIYEDVPEDLQSNNLRIALEVLEQYQENLGISGVEVLEYVKTRESFIKVITRILGISGKRACKIVEIIRGDLKGTG